MEWLNLFFQANEIWILFGGLILLLQVMILHKIKRVFGRLEQMESALKYESENRKVSTCVQPAIQQETAGKERQTELTEAAEGGQVLEESPEQLIDAVLAEVFR